MTTIDSQQALRFRFGHLLSGTTFDVPPGWCRIIEMMLEDVATITGTTEGTDDPMHRWRSIERKPEGLAVVHCGPADARVDGVIDSATQLAESTCECCGADGQRGWRSVSGVRCTLCAFEERLAEDFA